MTTNKQLIEIADEMAKALDKLTEGLAKDGAAIEGFTDALLAREKWSTIKLKRAMEKICKR